MAGNGHRYERSCMTYGSSGIGSGPFHGKRVQVKRSVAVLIRNGDLILSTRRPDDDELPGVWGLPAGTYRDSETLHDLVFRIGRDKLGVVLKPVRRLSEGSHQRSRYVLEMELWEAEMTGTPHHPAWQWAAPEILKPGILRGSLCCRLAWEALRS
jgi:ADP-ribose pyrophosphatase YjhB (NUDIX family)